VASGTPLDAVLTDAKVGAVVVRPDRLVWASARRPEDLRRLASIVDRALSPRHSS
jgi:hypothetical protein